MSENVAEHDTARPNANAFLDQHAAHVDTLVFISNEKNPAVESENPESVWHDMPLNLPDFPLLGHGDNLASRRFLSPIDSFGGFAFRSSCGDIGRFSAAGT
jgi:hypothetical protein